MITFASVGIYFATGFLKMLRKQIRETDTTGHAGIPEHQVSNMNTYKVAPFSGPRFRENERKLKEGETPCAICGKYVSRPYLHPVTVVAGGDWARTEAEEGDSADPGYMGVWGIGPDCHRKHLDRAV